jgi:hypothetical protein
VNLDLSPEIYLEYPLSKYHLSFFAYKERSQHVSFGTHNLMSQFWLVNMSFGSQIYFVSIEITLCMRCFLWKSFLPPHHFSQTCIFEYLWPNIHLEYSLSRYHLSFFTYEERSQHVSFGTYILWVNLGY